MTETPVKNCPECGAAPGDGFISYGSGILWHDSKPAGIDRFFLFAFGTGEAVLGSWVSSGFMKSAPAMRCASCGTIVFPRVVKAR